VAEVDSDKTEEPTPERRRKAREEGQFPRGRDAGNIAGSLSALLTLALLRDQHVEELRRIAIYCLAQPFDLLRGDGYALWQILARSVVLLCLPVCIAAAVGAFTLGLAEAGYHPIFKLAAPKWSRLDPGPKLQQLLMPQEAVVNIALQLLRVGAVAAVAFACVKHDLPILLKLSHTDALGAVEALISSIVRLALWSSLTLAVLAGLDYLRSRRSHETSLRMTRQEVKDEVKQHEGDPRTKQRQRARAREILRRGLTKAVRSSDFVVVNPTHVSVAIRYRVAEGAPVVTAKGYDEVALHIRILAKAHNIPIIQNAVLARLLAKRVREGRPIPVDLYAAVAEVLAFVYRLKNRSLDDLVR
jgi:flagellar biosynthesis protein FlhB